MTPRSNLFVALTLMGAACAAPPPPPPPPAPVVAKPAPPRGPTRTDFKTIAKKLLGRCVAGGWINEWRARSQDVDAARPKVVLEAFADETKQDLDPTYLRTTLQQRMRLSGVYDMVSDAAQADFIARGKLLRMAERVGGQRVSVYTALLDLVDTQTKQVAYTCEATVRGEM